MYILSGKSTSLLSADLEINGERYISMGDVMQPDKIRFTFLILLLPIVTSLSDFLSQIL
jgi:hypothetical protein